MNDQLTRMKSIFITTIHEKSTTLAQLHKQFINTLKLQSLATHSFRQYVQDNFQHRESVKKGKLYCKEALD